MEGGKIMEQMGVSVYLLTPHKPKQFHFLLETPDVTLPLHFIVHEGNQTARHTDSQTDKTGG